jgi:hypothetical protein
MPFTRNVEIGRLALVNYGPDYGKLVIVTDVLDFSRCLVDHPDQQRRVERYASIPPSPPPLYYTARRISTECEMGGWRVLRRA